MSNKIGRKRTDGQTDGQAIAAYIAMPRSSVNVVSGKIR